MMKRLYRLRPDPTLAFQVLTILDDLRKAVNDERAFFHALWKNMITSPTARIPAMNYLNERLPSADLSCMCPPALFLSLVVLIRLPAISI